MYISFILNHQPISIHSDPARPLLDVLRDDLGLTGTKRGCDYEGECGACTVLLDGQAVRSCLTPVGKVAGREVLTIEGLATGGRPGGENEPCLHPLQQAFIEAGAVQCGYCTPGMLMAAKALLDREPSPSRAQMIEALEGNLCRCTGYSHILEAVERAAALLRGESTAPNEKSDGPPVGGTLLRADAVDKVTGRARYVEDISMAGMLYAQVLRSPHHHARLRALHTAAAAQVPGVVCILTAADIPGENGLGDYSRNEPILAPIGDTVRMQGAPVALVVTTRPEAARAGLEAIEVAYEPLPHTFELKAALHPDAVPIYPSGNILTREKITHGDLEAAFAAADVVAETVYRTTYLEHAALEREAVLGYVDPEGRLTIVGATHQPHWQQGYIAAALALEPSRVRVITPPIGGSFGGKQDPWPLVATALAVQRVRRPVRLAYSRRESFDASPKRHPYTMHYRVGATDDGHLTGIRVRIQANTGGYDAHGQYLPNYALTASGGPYRWAAVDAQAQTVYTNGPKCGQFRGFGTPQSTFALECTLDELCQRLGQDPLEFRLRNALRQSEISFLGYPVAESLGYTDVLESLRPRYLARRKEVEAFNAASGGRYRRGLGLAGMWYRFGKSGSLCVEAQAELAPDGHFVVYCSAPDYGQGTNTVMSQLAAETLGLPRERVDLVNADTALTPDSGIQGASRATYWVGSAVCRAVQNLKHSVISTAAELVDWHPDDLHLQGDLVVARSEPARTVSLAQVARELDRLGLPRKTWGHFDLSACFPQETRPEYVPLFVTGAQLAEVEVDLHSGEVRVLRIVAAHDVGRAINPIDARGQIEGAVLMGLGSTLLEEYIPGASTGFSDYYLPTIRSMPEIEVILVEVPSFHGPLGAKGLGEAAILPTTPAIVNALSRAIDRRIRDLPATPERVRQAIRGAPSGPE